MLPVSVTFFPSYFCNFFREVSSGFFYKSAEEREKLVKAERKFIEDRVKKIVELKKKVCGDSDKGFVVINQKVRMKVGFISCVSFKMKGAKTNFCLSSRESTPSP